MDRDKGISVIIFNYVLLDRNLLISDIKNIKYISSLHCDTFQHLDCVLLQILCVCTATHVYQLLIDFIYTKPLLHCELRGCV